eukprot:6433530-Lingulodinium_polyedra.AAC.1
MVGAEGHELAMWAGVPEADAGDELNDPIGGVPEHVVLHALDEANGILSLAEVLQDLVDPLNRAVEALRCLNASADVALPLEDLLDLAEGAVVVLALHAMEALGAEDAEL